MKCEKNMIIKKKKKGSNLKERKKKTDLSSCYCFASVLSLFLEYGVSTRHFIERARFLCSSRASPVCVFKQKEPAREII